MKLSYNEDERIEHINGTSHCRCRNELKNDKNSCDRYVMDKISSRSRKNGMPNHLLCKFNNDKGYCQFSKIDEIQLINNNLNKLDSIVNNIVTEKGIKLLDKLGCKILV